MMMFEYPTQLAANRALFNEMKKKLDTIYSQGRTPRILLSGGNSPKSLYQMMGKEYVGSTRLKIGLVDERFVPLDHEQNNERMIRSCFSNQVELIGMVQNPENYENNLTLVQHDYVDFHENLDVVLLGMGGDGHYASIFPNDVASEQAASSSDKAIMNTNAPSYPKQRITCNLELLCGAKTIYLLIFGQDKLELLGSSNEHLPIMQLLKRRPDIQIYCSNDK